MAKKSFKINSSLVNALNETVSAAKNNAGDLNIEAISLDKVSLDPHNPRELLITITDVKNGINQTDPDRKQKLADIESLRSLSKSITEQGIINPILVYKDHEGYKLIAGERRTLASILSKKQDIPARVLSEKPDSLKYSLLQWIENIEREDLTLGEKLSNLEKIINAYASSKNQDSRETKMEDIANLLGCSNQLASNYKAVVFSTDELRSAIDNGKVKNLKKAALIARAPDDLKTLLISECSKGATEKNLKQLIVEKNKTAPKFNLEKRGKTTTNFKLNTKNPDTARIILDSILKHPKLTHLKKELDKGSLSEPRYVNKMFDQIIKSLEEA